MTQAFTINFLEGLVEQGNDYERKPGHISEGSTTSYDITENTYDAKVLDGPAIVNFLSTKGMSIFEDYDTNAFIPCIRAQLRVDVVWSIYRPG